MYSNVEQVGREGSSGIQHGIVEGEALNVAGVAREDEETLALLDVPCSDGAVGSSTVYRSFPVRHGLHHAAMSTVHLPA